MAKKGESRQLLTLDESDIPTPIAPPTIIKIRPYIYGTTKSIYDEDCKISVRADVWMTAGGGRAYFGRAFVDFDAGTITAEGGKKVEAGNLAQTLAFMGELILKAKGRPNK